MSQELINNLFLKLKPFKSELVAANDVKDKEADIVCAPFKLV